MRSFRVFFIVNLKQLSSKQWYYFEISLKWARDEFVFGVYFPNEHLR